MINEVEGTLSVNTDTDSDGERPRYDIDMDTGVPDVNISSVSGTSNVYKSREVDGCMESTSPHNLPPNYYERVYNKPYNFHNLDKAMEREQHQCHCEHQDHSSSSSPNSTISSSSSLTTATSNTNTKVQRKGPTPKASAVTVTSSPYVNDYHFDTNYAFNQYMNLYQASWDMILNVDANTEITDDLSIEEYSNPLEDLDQEYDYYSPRTPRFNEMDQKPNENQTAYDSTNSAKGEDNVTPAFAVTREKYRRRQQQYKKQKQQLTRKDRLKKLYDSSSEVCMRLHYNYKHRYNFAAVLAMEHWSRFIQFLVVFIILVYLIILSYAIPSIWQYTCMLITFGRDVLNYVMKQKDAFFYR